MPSCTEVVPTHVTFPVWCIKAVAILGVGSFIPKAFSLDGLYSLRHAFRAIAWKSSTQPWENVLTTSVDLTLGWIFGLCVSWVTEEAFRFFHLSLLFSSQDLLCYNFVLYFCWQCGQTASLSPKHLICISCWQLRHCATFSLSAHCFMQP